MKEPQRNQQGQERLADNSGIFMLALQAEWRERALEVPFVGIRGYCIELSSDDLAELETLFRDERR